MGLYLTSYAGVYLILRDLSYKKEVQEDKTIIRCPNAPNNEHGKQTDDNKFCPKCGVEIETNTIQVTKTKTVQRDFYHDDFMGIAGFRNNYERYGKDRNGNEMEILIPRESVGEWMLNLPENFNERGRGGYINFDEVDVNAMKIAFVEKYGSYLQDLRDRGFKVEVKVGLQLWYM